MSFVGRKLATWPGFSGALYRHYFQLFSHSVERFFSLILGDAELPKLAV
jgi:hypothetical protein